MNAPLHLTRNGHRTWLKWHRGRRRAADPAFTGARIFEAMQLGASVEVDLVIHADHGCAILHDLTLERETTGSGRVRDTGASALRQLHLRGNDGAPIAERVMLLEDLCALLADQPPHEEALLQLDFKEDRTALDDAVVDNFARSVAPLTSHIILSGGDFDANSLLADSTPGLRVGYDPCYGESLARLEASGDFAAFTSEALATAPEAEIIYIAYPIILSAAEAGYNMVGAIHDQGRRVDAWTIKSADETSKPLIEKLLSLRVDQITTDDPEGVAALFA